LISQIKIEIEKSKKKIKKGNLNKTLWITTQKPITTSK
jgi:hypothetical protein